MNSNTMLIPRPEVPVPPLSRSDVVSNVMGMALNGGWTVWGITWLVLNWTEVKLPWYLLVLTLVTGLFVSDFFSGLLHWTFDTWFTEDIPLLNRTVLIVREHHIYPQHIFRYQFYNEVGTVSWPSLVHTVPVIGLVTLTTGPVSVLGYCAVILSVLLSVITLFMLQFHKLGHRQSKSVIVRGLQNAHLLMSPKHHGQHHRGNHDIKYCLVNGWADIVMDAIGFWRGMEWLIHYLTGAIPRSNDDKWLKHYHRRRA